MKVVIGAFGAYLNQKKNSSEYLLRLIDTSMEDITTTILPVSYSKKAFIQPLKKYDPKIYIIIGNWAGNHVKLESKAMNKYVTLKSPLRRWLVNAYASVLWFFKKKNITVKKLPDKATLAHMPIEKKGPKYLKLKTIPKVKHLSVHGGYFVCNYAMYVIQRHILEKKLKTKFYFIHIPEKPTAHQEKEAIALIRSILHKQ